MITIENFMPVVRDSIPDIVVEAVRTILLNMQTQMNRVCLNALQVR